MADNIEIRLDQLTEAIKGLYAKSSMSQGEIYNALTGLSQRYENLSSISGEKIATTLVNEFRKTLELKYVQTNQYIKDLENALKSFVASYSSQNPSLVNDVTKILSDVSTISSKVNSQDLAVQKIFSTLEVQKNNNPTLEMAKLSENFLNFSRNFENITITLNKNFADFLDQLRQNSTKDETLSLQNEVINLTSNVNSIINSINSIDSKCKDLSGLLDLMKNNENIFSQALNEVKNLSNVTLEISQKINLLDNKQSLEIAANEVKSKIDDVKYEIQKIVNSVDSTELKTQIASLSSRVNTVADNINVVSTNVNTTSDFINSVSSNVVTLSGDVISTKEELKNVLGALQGLGNEVNGVRNLLNDEILYKARKNEINYEKYLNSSKEDVKTLLSAMARFRTEIDAINKGNIQILQDPINKALADLKNQDFGKDLKELSDNLRDCTTDIQSSIQNMQTNLSDLNSISSMQLLTKITEEIPNVSQKLEDFKDKVVQENSLHLDDAKVAFNETIQILRNSLNEATSKIENETRTINSEITDNLKVDLQKLSDHLTDSLETINEKLKKEFYDFKGDVQSLTIKQEDNLDKILEKISTLDSGIENSSTETVIKLADSFESVNAKVQDTLSEIKGDILDGVNNIDKSNKTTLSQFEQKLEKLVSNCIGADFDNIQNKKSLKEIVNDIETKIDRTNLQQIHNAKELLEEIQTSTSNLTTKMSELDESRNTASLMNALAKINEKINDLEDSKDEIFEEFQTTKEEITQKLKDNIQKISSLVEKSKEMPVFENSSKADIDELSQKVSEYLSNFEYLKSNISQEIKENLANEFENFETKFADLSREFVKIDSTIKKIKSNEENSSYSYCLEDVESDLAKVRVAIEKTLHYSDDLKLLYEKVIELRTVGLENVKINRDVETELGNISGWLRDTNSKIDDLAQNIEDVQKNSLQDIRSQLIQSERSKQGAGEFYNKIENVLKHIVKSGQNADLKIADLQKKLELMIQNQTETFNPSQFIDIFYENMTQTKILSNRVEIIEDKINSIQNAVEKLISYVEQ